MHDIQIGDIDAVSPQAWSIRGVIGGCSVIWGPPGNYKTFLAIGMAVCVAAGRPWFGCQVRQGPVLYILGEGGLDLFRRRAGMAAEYFGVDIRDLPLWVRAEALDMGAFYKLEPHYNAWDAISPNLVVIDTLSRCLPGDENKQETMQGFVGSMDHLRDRYGATVLALHHSGKDGNVRGSTVLPGAVDVNIRVRKIQDGLDRGMILDPMKLRDLETESFANRKLSAIPTVVRNGLGELVLDEYGDKVTTLVIQTKEDYGDMAATIVAAFSSIWKEGHWVGYREWFDASGMKVEAFKKALNHVLLLPADYDIVSPERGQYTWGSQHNPNANPLDGILHGVNYDTVEIAKRVQEANDIFWELKMREEDE